MAIGAALKRLGAVTYRGTAEDRRRSGFKAQIAGTMIRKQERRGRSDQPYAFVSLLRPHRHVRGDAVSRKCWPPPRPLLEPGKSVLFTVAAGLDGRRTEAARHRGQDLDKAAAEAGEGLRVYLEDERALGPIAMQLKNGGKGIVTLVVPASEGREVEIKIPQRQQVNAVLRAAIKSLPGVAAVESV